MMPEKIVNEKVGYAKSFKVKKERDRLPDELSGGQQQRLKIARA